MWLETARNLYYIHCTHLPTRRQMPLLRHLILSICRHTVATTENTNYKQRCQMWEYFFSICDKSLRSASWSYWRHTYWLRRIKISQIPKLMSETDQFKFNFQLRVCSLLLCMVWLVWNNKINKIIKVMFLFWIYFAYMLIYKQELHHILILPYLYSSVIQTSATTNGDFWPPTWRLPQNKSGNTH